MLQIVKNSLQLRRWLKSGAAISKQIYGKFLDERILLLSDVEFVKEREVAGWPWPISTQLDRLHVPSLEKANKWWSSLLASCEYECRVCDERLLPYRMCCMTRKGVWDALPSKYSASSKANYKLVSAKKFLKIVGPELDMEMGFECFVIGLSVRRIQKKRDRVLDKLMELISKKKKARKANGKKV